MHVKRLLVSEDIDYCLCALATSTFYDLALRANTIKKMHPHKYNI